MALHLVGQWYMRAFEWYSETPNFKNARYILENARTAHTGDTHATGLKLSNHAA